MLIAPVAHVAPYGSSILNDSNDLHLFHGHYRIILNNAVALVAISESNDNPFESHRLLEKVQNMVEQSYINMSNKKDFKLPTQKRIEKLHGELLLLLKRLLLRFDDVHGSNFITAKNNGMLGLDLSSEKKISNKDYSNTTNKIFVRVKKVREGDTQAESFYIFSRNSAAAVSVSTFWECRDS